jgi:hypothetical protein
MTDTPGLHASPLLHFIDRLQTTELIADPYPHYCLDRVFPEAFYRSLLRHLPDESAYQNLYEITTLKLDHFRFRDQRDLADGWTASLPDELRRFWDEFNAWFLGPDLARAVREREDGTIPAELLARLRTFGPVVPWCRAVRGG